MTAQAAQPTPSVSVELLCDRSLKVSWQHAPSNAVVKLDYYDPASPMIEPEEMVTKPCSGGAMHLDARAEPAGREACTAKVSLEVSGSVLAQTQTTWDDEFGCMQDCCDDLKKRGERLSAEIDRELIPSSGLIRILVVGSQHHGKSSFINHLYRCLEEDLEVNDQMETAPAGIAENTQEVLSCNVGTRLSLIDTPAIPTMGSENAEAFRALLKGAVSQGTRRREFARSSSSLWRPPHGAIVVMSLCHWRDQTEEMRSYLAAMANELKNASGGQVTFPFVVAATHRDEFLRDCSDEKPHEQLKAVLHDMKRAANTSHVFAVTNYQQGSKGSSSVNEQTFKLLSQLLTLAGRQNTGVVVARRQSYVKYGMGLIVSAVALPFAPVVGIAGAVFLSISATLRNWGVM